MDFARKILGKYGWKDGDGLGKNNDGIAKPLKATLKFDNAGLGVDQAASDFNNHWWERVFNDAANNLDVKQEGESVQMALVDSEEEVEISTKSYSMQKLKKAKLSRLSSTVQSTKSNYDNFLQAATLNHAGGEVLSPDRIDASAIEVTKVKVLTDEELFKACGGRTAHKGARHGLKQSGKLARLELQEKELLDKMLAKQNCVAETQKSKNKQDGGKTDTIFEREDVNLLGKEEPRKKKKRQLLTENTTEIGTPTRHEISNHRTKRKKNKKPLEETNEEKNQSCDGCESTNNKKIKKRKKDKNNAMSEDATNVNDEVGKAKNKGEKRMAKDAADNTEEHTKTKKIKRKSKYKKSVV